MAQTYQEFAKAAALRAGYDPYRLDRQIVRESGYNPDAHNDDSGADGISQIIPRFHPGVDTRDPFASIEYMSNLMASHMRATGGDMALALSYYNAGQTRTIEGLAGRVEGWPFAETVDYVSYVLEISPDEARKRLSPPTLSITARDGAPLSYAALTAPERQKQDWVCSIRAATWFLRSVGVDTDAGRMQDIMAPKYVTPKDGLLDGTGRGLATVLRGLLPFGAGDFLEVLPAATWAELWERAGDGPICAGAHGAYHWLNVAAVLPDGSLSSPNPAPNWPPEGPIGDTLTRQEFDTWGPWSLVFLDVPVYNTWLGEEAAPPAPLPTPVVIDAADLASLRAQLADKSARLDAEVSKLGYMSGDLAARLSAVAAEMRALAPPSA